MSLYPRRNFIIKATKQEVIHKLNNIINTSSQGKWNLYKGKISADHFTVTRAYRKVFNFSFSKKKQEEKIPGSNTFIKISGTVSKDLPGTTVSLTAKLSLYFHLFMLFMAVGPFIFVALMNNVSFTGEEIFKIVGIVCLPVIAIMYIVQLLACINELKIMQKDIEGLFSGNTRN